MVFILVAADIYGNHNIDKSEENHRKPHYFPRRCVRGAHQPKGVAIAFRHKLSQIYAVTRVAAVQRPDIKELSELRDVPREDVVEAVRSRTKISTEGDAEIIEIKLAGKNPQETVQLLNAILDAYLREAVGKDEVP